VVVGVVVGVVVVLVGVVVVVVGLVELLVVGCVVDVVPDPAEELSDVPDDEL
jgi:hypothetical protein